MTKRLAFLFSITLLSLSGMAQDDFGYDLSVAGETKLARGLKLEFEGSMRTQDDAERIDRFVLGTGLSYRLYQSLDKKIVIKANAGFDYLWTYNLAETENKYESVLDDNDNIVQEYKGYNQTDSYWRNRHRTSLGLSFSYTPNKRWSFGWKETVQYCHFCKVDSIGRTKWRKNDDDDDELFAKPSPIFKGHKDQTILRSKLSASYDIKGFPIDLFASIEYGCGLNYKANKWKFTGGYDYKINKNNKLSLYYRYNTEDDEDEVNGHLVGLGYKIDF